MLTLEVKNRDTKESPEQLRTSGFLPAVFYGKKEKSTPITIYTKDFLKVWKEAGESTVVVLKNGSQELETLIHDIDFDPVTGKPRHADFYVFEKGHKLEVDVPLEFTGVSSAVKDLGGVFVKVLHQLRVEALPKDLPHQIEVDISTLAEIGSQILTKDIKLPAGVDFKVSPDEVVALVAAPKEEEPEETTPIDLESIEVQAKGKEAKEGEEEVVETTESEARAESKSEK
ncbi:MAG TPA: 50S ribosomal protein L25 [Candidatus Paceibacterota bacterium]